jgi:hypothetical protein
MVRLLRSNFLVRLGAPLAIGASAALATSLICVAPAEVLAGKPPKAQASKLVSDKPKDKATADGKPRGKKSRGIDHRYDTTGSFETQPINGKTIDFDYDGMDIHLRSRGYVGRVFIPNAVLEQDKPVPIVVFFHGLNKALTPHRWMGGGQEGDIRRIILKLVESGEIPPVIVAGPGSVEPVAVSTGSSFPIFDLDKFVYLSRKAVAGIAEIDETRIIVSGHSGSGCTATGGVGCAVVAKNPPFAVLSIDTCMNTGLAEGLSRLPSPDTNVIVAYQTGAWERDFDQFRTTFEQEVAAHPPHDGVLRVMDELPTNYHDETPAMAYEKWLPVLLGSPRASVPPQAPVCENPDPPTPPPPGLY